MFDKIGVIMINLPFWMPRKKNAIWYFIFILIFIFSLDYWQWNINNPLILGLPMWVIYFFLLTIFTSFAFYIFSKYYWGDTPD